MTVQIVFKDKTLMHDSVSKDMHITQFQSILALSLFNHKKNVFMNKWCIFLPAQCLSRVVQRDVPLSEKLGQSYGTQPAQRNLLPTVLCSCFKYLPRMPLVHLHTEVHLNMRYVFCTFPAISDIMFPVIVCVYLCNVCCMFVCMSVVRQSEKGREEGDAL